MALRALFGGKPDPPRNPVQAEVPKLRDAELAAVHYGPRMGGDLYDFIRVNPDRVLFGLLDVAGRAEENATIVSAAQATFRERGPALFAKDDVNEAEAMIELCLELNSTILQSADGVRECPAFAGCYREGLGTVCYFNAGHTPGMLRDQTGVTELAATGLPLGLFSHAVSEAHIVALPPGAALLLVSRGVAEAKCEDTDFGLERVKEYFLQNKSQNASDLCNTLLTEMQQFTCAPPTHNDVTALALARRAAIASG
jgi:phosphoserine phosphatase RsbU/P